MTDKQVGSFIKRNRIASSGNYRLPKDFFVEPRKMRRERLKKYDNLNDDLLINN